MRCPRGHLIWQLHTGEYRDANGLYKIGLRYYDPNLGRWTQRDPLIRTLNPTQPSEANPYLYVGASPTNYTDPSGAAITRDLGGGGSPIPFPLAGQNYASGGDFTEGVLRNIPASSTSTEPVSCHRVRGPTEC